MPSPFLTSYLSRIQYKGSLDVTIDTLRSINFQHICYIPFENIDVVLPRTISLDDDIVEEKIVHAHRGGYCLELNGLFERALKEIGFNVRSLICRVIKPNQTEVAPRTHRLLLINIDDELWLIDTGFGSSSFSIPLRLIADIEQETPHALYRLLSDGVDWKLQIYRGGQWQFVYQFDLSKTYFSDFQQSNFWSANWPLSHSRHHLIVSRHLIDGRKITLNNFIFTEYGKDCIIEKREIPDVESLYQLIQDRFGIKVDDPKHGFTVDELSKVMESFDLKYGM